MLCLAAFLLGQTVFAAFGVRCTDAAGETRVEYGCAKSVAGHCRVACVDDHSTQHLDDHDDAPLAATSHDSCTGACDDEPLGPQLARSAPAAPLASIDFVPAPCPLAALIDAWSAPIVASLAVPGSWNEHERPPDALVRLRTVVRVE
ncbi:MAG: hypothetical protein U0572_14200 [Phycisphaerales bacterium]